MKNTSADNRIQHAVQKWMKKAAAYLDRKVNQLPRKTLKTGLILCVALAALTNLALIIYSVQSSRIIRPLRIIESITRSQTAPSNEIAMPDSVSKTTYHRMLKLRQFLDSLKASPKGKVLYDSLTLDRPGLEDSIDLLLKYFSPK